MILKLSYVIIWIIVGIFLSPIYSIINAQPQSKSVQLKINVQEEIGGATKIKDLLSAVGYDFSPAPELASRLRELGIKRLRLINVDNGNTKIVNGRLDAPHLDLELHWCRLIAAQPHIIIGQGIPPWLSTHGKASQYGPKDWDAYENYIHLFFSHVIIEKGFRSATWEVANEPDARGAPVPSFPRSPGWASEEDYQAYLQLYRHIATVATGFEKTHPGIRIPLGGPASCGPLINDHYAKFNWHRFLRDVTQNGLKLDFFSFHYYGNQSSIGNRLNLTPYPPFEKAMENLHNWIAQYKPGLPIWITEWGPSWITAMNPAGFINGNHVGAAYSATFVAAMFQNQIDKAIFLATADHTENWSWPALFHGTIPKPIYYVFDMFKRLEGHLVEVKGSSTAVGAIAARDGSRLTSVLWNYNWQRGEKDGGQECAQEERVVIHFVGLPVGMKCYRVFSSFLSVGYGNPFYLTQRDKEAAPDLLFRDLGTQAQQNGVLKIEISLSPSSVTFLEIFPGASPS